MSWGIVWSNLTRLLALPTLDLDDPKTISMGKIYTALGLMSGTSMDGDIVCDGSDAEKLPTAANYVSAYIDNINPKNPHTPSGTGSTSTDSDADKEVTGTLYLISSGSNITIKMRPEDGAAVISTVVAVE